jgi:hypothetical protein
MMDGCDENYKRNQSIQLRWTDCTQKGMKRYAKKYYITKIQSGWTNGYGLKKKRKHHPIGMDRYAKKYYIRKHPIRMETDMTRNIT